jgi:hypothetical protein
VGQGDACDPMCFWCFRKVKVTGKPYSSVKFSSNVEDTENLKDMDVNEVFDCTAVETEEVETAITTIMIVNKHSNPHNSVTQESGVVVIDNSSTKCYEVSSPELTRLDLLRNLCRSFKLVSHSPVSSGP